MNQHQLETWGAGQLFAFSGLDGSTDFAHGLVARSLREVGLLLCHPGETRITFGNGTWKSGTFGLDTFKIQTPQGQVRGAFVDTHHLLLEGDVKVELANRNRQVDHLQQGQRHLLYSTGHLTQSHLHLDLDTLVAQRSSWVQSTLQHWQPPQPWSNLAIKCLHQMKGMVYAPEGQLRHRSTTPDRWPHRQIWLWDSVFHAIGYRHLDASLARDALDAVFDAQQPNGQIAISASPTSTAVQRSQPPILAWGVELVDALHPNPTWIEHCLPHLEAYLAWFEHHRSLGPVFGWVEDGNHGNSVCDESGMDNSPRFSGTGILRAIDLTVFMAREHQAMARLLEKVGSDPTPHSTKAQALISHIENDFWNDELGIYTDIDHATSTSTNIEAVTGFLPLLLGSPSPNRITRLQAALNDPNRFGTTLPLPTLSRRHNNLYAKDMWKGPVWINTNWMVAEGFRTCGHPQTHHHIKTQTLNAMQQWKNQLGAIFEFYDDDNILPPPDMPRKGKNAPEIHPYHQVMHDFGWSATLAIDWMSTP